METSASWGRFAGERPRASGAPRRPMPVRVFHPTCQAWRFRPTPWARDVWLHPAPRARRSALAVVLSARTRSRFATLATGDHQHRSQSCPLRIQRAPVRCRFGRRPASQGAKGWRKTEAGPQDGARFCSILIRSRWGNMPLITSASGQRERDAGLPAGRFPRLHVDVVGSRS